MTAHCITYHAYKQPKSYIVMQLSWIGAHQNVSASPHSLINAYELVNKHVHHQCIPLCRVYVLYISQDYWLTRGWKPYDVLHIL